MRVYATALICLLTATLACQTPMERAYEYGFDPCPGLGQLSVFPKESTYLAEDGREILVLRNRSGVRMEVEKARILGAIQISTRERLDDFLAIYERACGSNPPYYDEIAWVAAERKREADRQAEEACLKREEAARLHREEGEKLAARLRELKRAHADAIQARIDKKEKLEALRREVSAQKPESFMITGGVTGKDASGVFFFGNAVPSGGSLVSPGAMLLSKGNGFLKAPREEDIILGQQLLAREVFFHGEGKAQASSGAVVPVNVYGYEAEEKSAARFNELTRQSVQMESDLKSLDQQLSEIDALEIRLRKEWPDIRISE
jgi:hypothetical protein